MFNSFPMLFYISFDEIETIQTELKAHVLHPSGVEIKDVK